MKKQLIFLAFHFSLASYIQAQTFTISGFVQDAETKERLISANVYDNKTLKGTYTNNFGYFSISFNKGDSMDIAFSYISYEKQVIPFIIKGNIFLNINLKAGNKLKELLVTGNNDNIEKRTEMSVIEIPIKQIKSLPLLMGEADAMRAFQLMPGIQSGKEGSSGIYVRGGSPDQNLFLLDDVPLYYVSHIGGFISTFDVDAINNIKLYKGGFPARFGGRLSSVVDIRMKDGDMNHRRYSYTLGLLSSKLSFEGPIKKDTSSYFISLRRCNLDLITRPVSLLANNYNAWGGYNFYDLNIKLNRKLSDKSRLFFSFYSGRDKIFINAWDVSSANATEYKYKFKSNIKWGNLMGNVRFNHIFNTKLFCNLTLSFTKFFYSTAISSDKIDKIASSTLQKESLIFNSGVHDYFAKFDFDYYPNYNNKIKFGADAIYHTFLPGISSFKESGSNTSMTDTTSGSGNIYADELNLYIEDELKISKKFSANIGFHSSVYIVNDAKFPAIQPRVSLNYLLTDNLSVKGSYAEMKQYIHLLSNSGAGLPTDLWMPATNKLAPENSKQVAVGIAQTIMFKSPIEWSIESFYKLMDNQIEYKEGTSFLTGNQNWENKVEINGHGKIYGVEFLIQKKEGVFTGWVGYTLSKNTRQFDKINNGIEYPYKYDRRHDLSLVANYQINEKISLSGSWVFSTGDAITLAQYQYPVFAFEATNSTVVNLFEYAQIYNGRNSSRMPSYHRLDLGVTFTKIKKKGVRTWNFSIYNVYNRQNPYFLYYKKNNSGEIKLYQLSLFPFIPSVSYSFKF